MSFRFKEDETRGGSVLSSASTAFSSASVGRFAAGAGTKTGSGAGEAAQLGRLSSERLG